jgi:NAD(P)-dependent dehydrogenase (short-subunit alcohol dehydrogenase family)
MSNELRFDGRVAIVTGAGGGLGRSHARMLAARGARVVVNDVGSSERDGTGAMGLDLASGVVDEIAAAGGDAIPNTDTVATEDGAAALIAQALDTWGRLDIVVNNAGITGRGALAELDVYERVFATHIFGTANVLRAAWPHFAEADYGRVVNTCSSSMFGTQGSGDYASAKGAIFGLSRVLATDNRDRNIRINVLMPIAYTRMTAAMPDEPTVSWFEHWFQPEKVSAFVAYLCHESVECSGETFTVGGGRAARVVFATTRGSFQADATPESFRDHFDEVMAGEEQRHSPTGLGDLARYNEWLPEPAPF